jgi:hypothetical protein
MIATKLPGAATRRTQKRKTLRQHRHTQCFPVQKTALCEIAHGLWKVQGVHEGSKGFKGVRGSTFRLKHVNSNLLNLVNPEPFEPPHDDVRNPLDIPREEEQRWGMNLDVDACYRAFRTRDAPFDGRLSAGSGQQSLLPSELPSAHARAREHDVLCDSSGSAGSGLPSLPALSAGPAPELAAWRGTSNTVSRALALIDAGALD